MIELLKDIMVDFILFSVIEGAIFCLFFNIVGECKKFKWWEIGILSLVNCVASQTLPPVIYQFIGLVYMGVYIYFRDKMKIKNAIKIVFFASMYMLVLEMMYSLFLSFLFNVDSFSSNKFDLFIRIIPMRIIEISLLIFGSSMMENSKWWIGDNIKRK